ncbi:hypothetical protein [Bradyrhizobium sp. CCGE-LA001]|uniref:hypothetical protein n=1 Tax=Bradyrhizobium sp. CCGE-LA001 TaxID=1223566 RepID=UPI0011981EF3|nr:hypothetical protein [Bradyrhizobium sp. CCGE-LA001]
MIHIKSLLPGFGAFLGNGILEHEMGERSELKQVCRRNALGFLGSATVFGLFASSAGLTALQAEAQTAATPSTPATPPADASKPSATGPEYQTRRMKRRASLRARRKKALERAIAKKQ